jgi:sigma-E factor negative regulatory protein RseA
MDTKEMAREQISALADGELADEHIDMALAALRHQEERADWEIYHQIGDVLRSDDMAVALSSTFAARMMDRLEAEPTVIAPPNPDLSPLSTVAGNSAASSSRAAFPRSKRWAVPGMIAAAVATVAFVATPQLMVAMKDDSSILDRQPPMASAVPIQPASLAAGAPLAAAERAAAAPVATNEGVVLRDPRIDDYLLAHQRFSPSMYSTAQFARSATFETAPGK